MTKLNPTMTIEEYAKHQDVSKVTVYDWLKKGMRKYSTGNRQFLRIDPILADRWLVEQKNGKQSKLSVIFNYLKFILKKQILSAILGTFLLTATLLIITYYMPRTVRLELITENQTEELLALYNQVEQQQTTIDGLIKAQEEAAALVELAHITGYDIASAVEELQRQNPEIPLPDLQITYGLAIAEQYAQWYAEKVAQEQEDWGTYQEQQESRPRLWPVGIEPTGRLSSHFGERLAARGSALSKATGIIGWHWHRGIDIVSARGAEIIASAAGEAVLVEVDKTGDKYIIIDHGHGYETHYRHLDSFTVTEGNAVEAGQVIGHMGDSGMTTGVHLHFETHFEGRPINPLSFLELP